MRKCGADMGGNVVITHFNAESLSGMVNIPAVLEGRPVTCIGRGAFWDCGSITGVVIPEGVMTISECAFRCCKSLAAVSFPASVRCIDDQAFEDCTGLKSVTVPGEWKASAISCSGDARHLKV